MTKKFLFTNGEVITVNSKNEIVNAVAVEDNRIAAVGSTDEILKWKDGNSTVIDLDGRTILPGFIESHLHITLYGTNELSVSCKDESVQTISDLLEKLKEKAKDTLKGEWIRAWGFNDQKIEDGRFPTKEELDSVSDEHPIIVVRACNHISAVNSYALQLASIDKNTPDPEGGKIVRRDNGEPSGLLLENAHMQMFQIAGFTREEIRQAHSIASEHFVQKGITSIHDATGYGISNVEALKEDTENDVIKQRVYAMIGALNDPESVVKHFLDCDVKTNDGNDRFKYGPVKLFLDGSSSGPTVWTREPYDSDPTNYGIHYHQQEEIEKLFIPAHQKGWQITSHAQGDAAIDMLLTCIEKANKLYPREDARHRIEHAGIAQKDLIERMVNEGVIPTPNPAFFFEYGDGYIKNYGDRAKQMYPLNCYIQAGVPAAIASDCPVTDFNPLRGIHSAITRISPTGAVVGEKERIGLLDAIRMITWNGAYASFSENETGSIEVGKRADLIILDRSILNAKTDEIPSIKVVCTMIDGEVVYEEKHENEAVKM
ncbi:amidohydrolase [Neobacillus terrae]|uniref:amidohydrolase n=1 Tax=Neobacillus terrae TaxID=3034837 RepID=UPI00140B1041|nr:amidohydrolase [Neobacillus terrae]NHM30699.1 amidohydrolase [Neobacillus terrae]